eukprot:scaffold11034_cov32-Attheya_sp.AAC.2
MVKTRGNRKGNGTEMDANDVSKKNTEAVPKNVAVEAPDDDVSKKNTEAVPKNVSVEAPDVDEDDVESPMSTDTSDGVKKSNETIPKKTNDNGDNGAPEVVTTKKTQAVPTNNGDGVSVDIPTSTNTPDSTKKTSDEAKNKNDVNDVEEDTKANPTNDGDGLPSDNSSTTNNPDSVKDATDKAKKGNDDDVGADPTPMISNKPS